MYLFIQTMPRIKFVVWYILSLSGARIKSYVTQKLVNVLKNIKKDPPFIPASRFSKTIKCMHTTILKD